jgi:hypothetical protein
VANAVGIIIKNQTAPTIEENQRVTCMTMLSSKLFYGFITSNDYRNTSENQLFSYTVNDHGHAGPAAAAPAYQVNTMFLKHKHEHQRRSVTLAVHGNVTHAFKNKMMSLPYASKEYTDIST